MVLWKYIGILLIIIIMIIAIIIRTIIPYVSELCQHYWISFMSKILFFE